VELSAFCNGISQVQSPVLPELCTSDPKSNTTLLVELISYTLL